MRMTLSLLLTLVGLAAPAQPAGAAGHVDPSLKHLENRLGPADGVVRGKVVSEETGEALPAATIMVVDPATGNVIQGAVATLKGTFEIVVPAGTYRLKGSFISYACKTTNQIEVMAGMPTVINLALTPESLAEKEVVVEGRTSENTEVATLIRQQRAPAVTDGLSAEQISRSPDADAADAVRRLTGISLIGDKYVYVRGLGERYSSTQLNGARMTSTDPSRRVVPLDMFPAKLIDAVTAQKTYTSDQWAEFAGGAVQIDTKTFPDELTIQFGQSLGVEPSSTLRSFRTYPGGAWDFLGFDDGRRELPADIEKLASDQKVVPRGRFSTTGFTPEELETFGESFDNIWDPRIGKSRINQGYHLTVGDKTPIFGRTLGYVGSLSYGGNYDQRKEWENSYTASAAGLVPDTQYEVERSVNSVDLGALLNTTFRLTPTQEFSFKNTYTRNAEDEVRVYSGVTNENQDQPLRDQRLRYVERSMLGNQLGGEHLVPPLAHSVLSWKLSRSHSTRDEPDNREVLYRYDPVTGKYQLYDVGESGQRFFSTLDDNELGVELKWSLPLPSWAWKSGKVEVGYFHSDRDRDFAARRFRFVPKRDASTFDLTAPAEQIFAPDHIGPNGFQLEEKTRATDAYRAEHTIHGGFVSADFTLSPRFRLITGLRAEDSNQHLTTYELGTVNTNPVVADNRATELAPSASLVVKLGGKTNLRLAASRTFNRPDFRELAPFEYSEFVRGRAELGNPDLKDAVIRSYDVRLERFPGLGEVQALSLFAKNFDRPIEVVVLPGVSRTVTYDNAEGAKIIGAEAEVRRRLGFLSRQLSALNLGCNLTAVHSEVDVAGEGVQTNRQRPLQGQSPYLVNASLGYMTPSGRTGLNVFYNVFGKRIREVGANGLPDVYERMRNTIDATGSTRFNHHIEVKVAAKNLLDHQHRFEQAGLPTEVYQTGRSYSLSLAYDL